MDTLENILDGTAGGGGCDPAHLCVSINTNREQEKRKNDIYFKERAHVICGGWQVHSRQGIGQQAGESRLMMYVYESEGHLLAEPSFVRISQSFLLRS